MPPPLDLLPLLGHGLLVTLEVTAAAAALAGLCALLAGLGRISRDPIVRWFSIIYIETFRGTSALVQLFWFYFALPLLGLGIELSALQAGILVLGLNIGAYGAVVVRGAILAVPQAQYQAAVALNMTRHQRLRYVILPQAFRAMLPPFGNLLIELLKSTALLSMIELTDLTRAGKVLVEGEYLHRDHEVFGLLLLIYFALSLAISRSVRLVERRVSVGIDVGGT